MNPDTKRIIKGDFYVCNKTFLLLSISQAQLYKTVRFSVYRINLESTGWASYILCGVQGVMDLLAKTDRTPVSMQLAISGNIPPSSGLSSSSALVCAGVLATALANKVTTLDSVPGCLARNLHRLLEIYRGTLRNLNWVPGVMTELVVRETGFEFSSVPQPTINS